MQLDCGRCYLSRKPGEECTGDLYYLCKFFLNFNGFSGGSVVKNLLASAGDTGSIFQEDPMCQGATQHHNY